MPCLESPPSSGRRLTPPTLDTPGIARSRSEVRERLRRRVGVVYRAAGIERVNVSRPVDRSRAAAPSSRRSCGGPVPRRRAPAPRVRLRRSPARDVRRDGRRRRCGRRARATGRRLARTRATPAAARRSGQSARRARPQTQDAPVRARSVDPDHRKLRRQHDGQRADHELGERHAEQSRRRPTGPGSRRASVTTSRPPAGAERGSHGHLAPPRGRARKQQVRDVDARNQQHDADRGEQQRRGSCAPARRTLRAAARRTRCGSRSPAGIPARVWRQRSIESDACANVTPRLMRA